MTIEQTVRYSVLLSVLGSVILALWVATAVIGLSWGILLVLTGNAGWVAVVFGGVLFVVGILGFAAGRKEARLRHEARMGHRLGRAAHLDLVSD